MNGSYEKGRSIPRALCVFSPSLLAPHRLVNPENGQTLTLPPKPPDSAEIWGRRWEQCGDARPSHPSVLLPGHSQFTCVAGRYLTKETKEHETWNTHTRRYSTTGRRTMRRDGDGMRGTESFYLSVPVPRWAEDLLGGNREWVWVRVTHTRTHTHTHTQNKEIKE